jgi:dihydroxyacetone kinase-like predicted kinase
MGKSLIVVGDLETIRIHIHTLEPDKVTRLVANYGKLADLDIRNMDEQHKDFLLVHKGKVIKLETATVAVVNGNGFANVLSDLGISAIITGGQTMNPSTMDILQAVEAVPSNNVILLPNNKNIIPTANQVQELTRKNIKVIPTESIPQGVAALVSFSPEADFKTNFEQMIKVYSTVKTIEITRSTRTMKFDGLEIREGQTIGLLDGKLTAVSDKVEDLIIDMLSRMDLSSVTIITMYFSNDNEAANAEAISNKIRQLFPRLEVETLNGGQPHYNYIISVE